MGLKQISDNHSIVKVEEEIFKKWTKENTFQKCLKMSKGRPEYVFYDGPPFATGSPHYGHILAGTIKDVIAVVGSRINTRTGILFFTPCNI